MTDITERLRRYKRDRSGYAEYCHQAADEIEHLMLDLQTERAAVVALRAELAARAETGLPMSRGTSENGTPKMGTMRDVLLDYMQAAEAEAGEVDKLRAEVAGLREDAERWRHVRDKSAWTATSANGMTRIAIRLPVDTPIEADDELDAAIDAARRNKSGGEDA